jgi:kinesin family protein 1
MVCVRCLIYQIKAGRTSVGNIDSTETLDIRLSGASVLSVHCYFETLPDGSVTIHAVDGGTTMVNGLRIGSDKVRTHSVMGTT